MNRNKICILPKLNDCRGNPKGKWFVYYSYRNPADNKMKRFRLYEGFAEHRTKNAKYEHAEKLIEKYTYLLENGWTPFEDESKVTYEDNLKYTAATRIIKGKHSGNKTFNYYSNLFLPEVEGMADKTYKNYVSKYRLFDAWLTNNGYSEYNITAITPEMMRNFFLFLINHEKLARITVLKYRQILERFFDWCIKHRFINFSPMQDLPETTRENDTAPRPINENDIDKLVKEIIECDRQLWLVVQLEYYCFLRPGLEIRFAKIGWFDLARNVISIPKEFTKTRKNKMVIIPHQLREYLLNELRVQLFPPDYYLIGQNGVPGLKPLGNNNLRNRFNRIRDRLKLPKEYKLYSFKHTGNSRLIDTNIPMYHIQRQNGHESWQSTEEYIKNKIGFKSSELENNFPPL